MKLIIEEINEQVNCSFKGNPEQTVTNICLVMSQHPVLANIILAAAEVYTDNQADIHLEVENSFDVTLDAKKTTP